jgi:predicted PurR-regulated permease PerM
MALGTPDNPPSPGQSALQPSEARISPTAGSPAAASQAARPTWTTLHLWQIQPVRDALLVLVLVGLVWAGYKLSIVTVPLLLALLLAYLVEPLVARVTRTGTVRRPFAVLSLIVLSTLLVVVPATLALTYGAAQGTKLAQTQVRNIESLLRSVGSPDNDAYRASLPSARWKGLRDWLVEQEARAKLSEAVTGVRKGVGEVMGAPKDQAQDEPKDTPKEAAKEAPQQQPQSQPALASDAPAKDPAAPAEPAEPEEMSAVSGAVAQIVSQGVDWLRTNAGQLSARAVQAGADVFTVAAGVLSSLAKLAFGGFLTLFFFFFFSVGFGNVRSFFRDLVPEARRERVFSLADRMDRVIAGFVRGRLTICACQIVLFTMLYWAIGVPAPFIVGPLVGVLTLAPYAAALGMPVAMALMFLSPAGLGDFRDNWWWILAAPIGVQAISQVLDDYILSPMIQGKNTDMSMPLILFATIAGGVLGGFYGLLLAIPVAACGKILVTELVLPHVRAWSTGKASDLLPINR